MKSLEEYLDDLKSGDVHALNHLIAACQDRVYNTIISIVQNAEDAQELTQDVFIELYLSAHKFRGDSKVTTWLYRIASNKSLDHLKKKNRKKRFAFLSSLFDPQSGIQLHDKPNFEHPGVLLEQKEHARYLYAAIDRLPSNQKIAYVLNKIEGRSNKEIMDIMELSLSAVDSLLHRARKNLKVELAEYYNKMKS